MGKLTVGQTRSLFISCRTENGVRVFGGREVMTVVAGICKSRNICN